MAVTGNEEGRDNPPTFIERRFRDTYRSQSGRFEFNNPPLGEIGWYLEDEQNSPEEMEQMANDFGLNSLKIAYDDSLKREAGVPVGRLVICNPPAGVSADCNNPFGFYTLNFTNGGRDLRILYNITRTDLALTPVESAAQNWGTELTVAIPLWTNKGIDSQPYKEWRDRWLSHPETPPLRLSAPLKTA